MNKTVVAFFVPVFLLTGCGPEKLPPEKQKQIAELNVDCSRMETEISSAYLFDQTYPDELIHSLVSARIHVLKENRAMLQRVIKRTRSAKENEEGAGTIGSDPAVVRALKNELEALQATISDDKTKIAAFSDPALRSIIAAGIAAEEKKRAIVEQRYLSAKYGIATGDASRLTGRYSGIPLPPASEHDAIFGLREGLTKNEIEARGIVLLPVEGQRNFYGTTSLSKTNQGFERFFLTISPDAGLCIVQGVGASVETDSYGMRFRQKFQERATVLDAAYGQGEITDVLLDGSIWKAPGDWMMGLKKQQRILSEAWDANNDGLQRNHLKSVYMESIGIDMTTGYFVLKYMFNNVDVCIKEYRQLQTERTASNAVPA